MNLENTRAKVVGAFSALVLAVALSSATTACDIAEPEEIEFGGPEEGDLLVLFVGASHLEVNHLPGIFRGLAEAAGKDVYVGGRIQSGQFLDFFADDNQTREAIKDQDWDYVVVSGGCNTVAYPDTHHLLSSWDRHDPRPALTELRQRVKNNNPDAELVLMMPWAFEDGLTWIAGQTDTYFDMQEKIRDNSVLWGDSLDIVIAPAGMAWYEVLQRNVPLHYLHLSDWNHADPRGSFLAAATIFSTIYRESSAEVDYSWVLEESDAEDFRDVASRTVLDNLEWWNITP